MSRLGRVGQFIETVWGIVSKGGLIALIAVVLGIGVYEVVRECTTEIVLLEPVVVKGPVSDGGPTVEMATQQISSYIDKIQQTGAREWRAHAFAESEPSISIQIPGSSLTVDSVVRAIADLFPHKRRILKVSITANPSGKGYSAAVTVSGNRSPKRKVCETDTQPGALGKMFECIAFEATRIVDPLFASSYALSQDEEQCARFEPEQFTPTNPVSDMKRLLHVLRDYCSFSHTRATVAKVISRGREDDQPWVSYIYGKLHLARADAVAKVDSESQWYEFDRAIARLEEFSQNDLPPSAKAILMEAYIKNGLSIQHSVAALSWKTHEDFISQRLGTAKEMLRIATQRLETKQPQPLLTRRAAAASGPIPPAAMASHMRGLILYRQWMIETRSRYPNGDFGFAEGDEEKAKLAKALEHFEAASHPRQPFEFFIEWGNTLRALGKFDEAVKQYRRAADIEPKSYFPAVNIAVALLEQSHDSLDTNVRFAALRQTSNYLTWVSDGGPFTTLLDKIADALRGVGDDGIVAEDFAFCRWGLSVHEADPRIGDMSHTAALKYCVDQARDSLGRRLVEEIARAMEMGEPKPVDPQLSQRPGGDLQGGPQQAAVQK